MARITVILSKIYLNQQSNLNKTSSTGQ